MARTAAGGKGNADLTTMWHSWRRYRDLGGRVGNSGMAMLAIAMFVALFAFGKQIFGWHDSEGNVQIALLASFLFGVIAAFRNR